MKRRPVLVTVSFKTINNKINIKNMFKKWKAVLILKTYWDIIASVRASAWFTLTMMLTLLWRGPLSYRYQSIDLSQRVKQVYFWFDNRIMQTPIKIPHFCMPLLNVNRHYPKIWTTPLNESTELMILAVKK